MVSGERSVVNKPAGESASLRDPEVLCMSAGKANILVVDDVPEKLVVYRSILDDLGYNVIAARSGAEALKYVLQNDFAVILLDVRMPDVDGFETATLIRNRKRSAHTPIIFITAMVDEVRAVEGDR